MNYVKTDIGILLQPSIRSLAYLSIFRSLGMLPAEVYMLKGSINKFSELIVEDNKFHYQSNFFDLSLDAPSFLRDHGVEILELPTDNINDISVTRVITQRPAKYLIFTGGGILTKESLDCGKKIIHVHPGIVPDFRGSTCFYYSILEDGCLGASAIFMDANLDTGEVIVTSKFNINYLISHEQPLFMDYVVDPFIRAYTLGKVLKQYSSANGIKSATQISGNRPAYYIMHPLLRHMAIKRVNALFNEFKPIGIFEVE